MSEHKFNYILKLSMKCCECCRKSIIAAQELGGHFTIEQCEETFALYYDYFLAPKLNLDFFEKYKEVLDVPYKYLAINHYYSWLRSWYMEGVEL